MTNIFLKYSVVFLLTLILGNQLVAKSNASKRKNNVKYLKNLETKKIHNQLKKIMPQEFCKKDSTLRKCYGISQKHCIKAIKSGLKNCFDLNSQRRSISSDNLYQYSQELAVCVTRNNRRQNFSYRRKCENPDL